MSSAGQIIGGVAGAAIGFFVGNPILGAQIGMMVGSVIDPPKGPSITGPRLEDLSVQTATYGAPLPRGYGTVCVSGNIFWLENDQIRELTTTEEQGGKGGGGGQEVTTYHYSATFAVGLMHVPDGSTISLRRLWIDTDLIYEAGSSNVESVIASNNASGFTFYDGSDDQLPNPRMQADKGANNVSAYPGLCYLVFEDLNLEKYSNTLMRAQIKAELVVGSPTPTNAVYGPVYDSQTISPQRREITSITWSNSACRYAIALETSLSNIIPYGISFYTEVFGEGAKAVTVSVPDTWGSPYTWTSPMNVKAVYSDEPIAIFVQERQGSSTQRLRFITPTSDDYSPSYINGDAVAYGANTCAHGNGETFIARLNGPIAKFVGVYFSLKTAASYAVVFMGLSKNYLFGVKRDSGSQTTVYKFLRADLSLVATYTAAVPNGAASIQVVDDDTFYTASAGNIYLWKNGVVVDQLPALTNINSNPGNSTPAHESFAVINDYPAFGYYIFQTGDSTIQNIEYFYAQVPSTAAKLRTIVTNECALAGITSADIDLAALTNSDVRGFRLAQRGPVRNSLELLQAAYPFDVAQAGYKIRFVSRGGAACASIPEVDLGASDGKTGVLLPISREMDSQLPFRVSIRYTDPDREYDLGEQSVERYEKDSLNERVVELPLSLTATEAVKMADILLAKDWVERVEFGPFSLPPTWRNLEPADVVTISHRGQSYDIRLARIEYLNDGRVVCSGKLTAAASYTSSAVAQAPLTIGQSLVPLAGSSQVVLLDIPRINAAQDVAGMAAVMYGLASGWPGGALCRSDDQGQTWQPIASFNTKARVFTVAESAGSSTSYAVDSTTVITLTPVHGGATLYATTDDQLYAHTNLAAWGADGRWEICAFKTVVNNSGTYTVRDFLRGLYGSEWATGLHAAGDTLVMLDTSSIGFVGLPVSAIGSERQYKAVTQGQAVDSSADIDSTYSAVNLKPLSPVDVNADRGWFTGDWTITAQRRTRWPVELFSGAAVPLGETAESYDLDILDSSLTTVKRAYVGLSTPVAIYPSTDQVTDFGGAQSTIYGRWCQRSSMVGRGFYQYFQITRSASLIPYGEYVVLQMHNDDPALLDVMGHPVTKIGSVARVSDASAYGGYAAAFNGSTDALRFPDSPDWTISGDFLIEARIRVDTLSHDFAILSHWYPGNASGCAFIFGVRPSGKLVFVYGQGGSNPAIEGTSATVSVGTYVWVAVWRNGSTLRMSVAGSTDATSATISGALNNCPLGLGVGVTSPDISSSDYVNGRIDELRFTNGSCMGLTTTWTPPTSALPNPI